VVAETVVKTLEGLQMRYPEPPEGWKKAVIE
jgi:hypothetical protein